MQHNKSVKLPAINKNQPNKNNEKSSEDNDYLIFRETLKENLETLNGQKNIYETDIMKKIAETKKLAGKPISERTKIDKDNRKALEEEINYLEASAQRIPHLINKKINYLKAEDEKHGVKPAKGELPFILRPTSAIDIERSDLASLANKVWDVESGNSRARNIINNLFYDQEEKISTVKFADVNNVKCYDKTLPTKDKSLDETISTKKMKQHDGKKTENSSMTGIR